MEMVGVLIWLSSERFSDADDDAALRRDEAAGEAAIVEDCRSLSDRVLWLLWDYRLRYELEAKIPGAT